MEHLRVKEVIVVEPIVTLPSVQTIRDLVNDVAVSDLMVIVERVSD